MIIIFIYNLNLFQKKNLLDNFLNINIKADVYLINNDFINGEQYDRKILKNNFF